MSRCLKICSTACASLLCATSHGHAAIVCEGNFQIVDGVAISTPYCQDENLAANERKVGRRVSGAEVRHRPELKREACTLTAVTNEAACSNYVSD